MSATVLHRIDAIAGAFDPDHVTLSLAGLVARTGLPRTTVYRHAKTLVRVGWLTHENGRYRLGDRLFELGSRVRLHTRLREPAAPYLHELAAAAQQTVHLAVLDGSDVLYIDKVDSRRSATTGITRVGGRRPAHSTAIGKALVSASGDRARSLLLASRPRRYTAATIVEPTRLEAELGTVAERGIAVDREETAVGLVCLAAPVLDAAGRCVAAVSISGTADRHRPGELIASLLKTTARIRSRVVTVDAAITSGPDPR